MYSLIQLSIIYNNLYVKEDPSYNFDNIKKYLLFKIKETAENSESYYNDLLIQINSLSNLDRRFIEQYCLSKISNIVIDQYAVNIAEAYVIAFVLLNSPASVFLVCFKLGNSGLLTTTNIKGTKITDIDALANYVLKSLQDAKLIKITDNDYIIPGINLSIKL